MIFAEYIILHIESPKYSTNIIPELINELNKIARCKINIQKSVAFLFTENLLHFIHNYQKVTLRKQFHLQLHPKIPRNKFN